MCLPVFGASVYSRKVTVGWLVFRHCLLILSYLPILSQCSEKFICPEKERTLRIRTRCREQWRVPVIPALKQWVRQGNQEFHASQSHPVKPCFKNKERSLRLDSEAKCNCCSYRGSIFVPRTHMVAYNLQLQFQETWGSSAVLRPP